MIQIGKYNTLTILRDTKVGLFLGNPEQDPEGIHDILLPNKYVPNEFEIGEELIVFVYLDHEQRPVATTLEPYILLNEFALLRVNYINQVGAFMDWGIIKDLFIPYKQQKSKIIEGKRYLVYVYIDDATGLITGTTKFKRNPQYEDLPLRNGDKVDLIIMNESELGWNVVINKKYIGLIYASDVFKKLYPLSEESGYIKTIREDGKIDVSLQPQGFENVDEFKQKIIDKLNDNYGLLYLSDKSSPEEIKEELLMSKKNFKKAIGSLYKDKVIEIKDDRISLL